MRIQEEKSGLLLFASGQFQYQMERKGQPQYLRGHKVSIQLPELGVCNLQHNRRRAKFIPLKEEKKTPPKMAVARNYRYPGVTMRPSHEIRSQIRHASCSKCLRHREPLYKADTTVFLFRNHSECRKLAWLVFLQL